MLSSTAQRILAQGCSVVLDAADLQQAERMEIEHLAATCGIRFVGLFLTADLATRLAGSNSARAMLRCNTERRPEAGDFRDRRGKLAYIDASGTPDQSLRNARVSLLAAPDER